MCGRPCLSLFTLSCVDTDALILYVYVYIILNTGCAGLRKKTVAPGASGLDDHLRASGSTDLFGSADAIVKHLLEVVHLDFMYVCTYVHVYSDALMKDLCSTIMVF